MGRKSNEQTQVPGDQRLAEQHGKPCAGRERRAEWNLPAVLRGALFQAQREDNADQAREEQREEVQLPVEIYSNHEKQLDVAASHGFFLENPLHDQHDEEHGQRNADPADQGGQGVCPHVAGEQDEQNAAGDSGYDQPVGYEIRLEVRKGNAKENRGEDEHFQRF
ncbi:hypothetical protein SDC9_144636 [bioreactor metagenome]|uniref:Uncharacterized protein n=1 Tax=bioreactor metagenome TaxID=1076179 RepID=A0A645E9G8_9ZZZZ